MEALEYILGLPINHFNKLRESYKELYLLMKGADTTHRIKNLRLTEKRKHFEDYSDEYEKDFIELDLANEFSKTHTSIRQPKETKRAKTGFDNIIVQVDTNDNSNDSNEQKKASKHPRDSSKSRRRNSEFSEN